MNKGKIIHDIKAPKTQRPFRYENLIARISIVKFAKCSGEIGIQDLLLRSPIVAFENITLHHKKI